jgi:hypothetical protein
MTEQEQLTKILALVEKLDKDIQETNTRIQAEVKNWDDRFFPLVKEQGQTSQTIIIAAASVVVLSPILGTVAEFVARLLAQSDN